MTRRMRKPDHGSTSTLVDMSAPNISSPDWKWRGKERTKLQRLMGARNAHTWRRKVSLPDLKFLKEAA